MNYIRTIMLVSALLITQLVISQETDLLTGKEWNVWRETEERLREKGQEELADVYEVQRALYLIGFSEGAALIDAHVSYMLMLGNESIAGDVELIEDVEMITDRKDYRCGFKSVESMVDRGLATASQYVLGLYLQHLAPVLTNEQLIPKVDEICSNASNRLLPLGWVVPVAYLDMVGQLSNTEATLHLLRQEIIDYQQKTTPSE